MRIFVAGASGAIGRPLVRLLANAGHDIVGMARSENSAEAIRADGATPVVADALDRAAVTEAVRAAEPEVVVHQLTAIPPAVDPRSFAEEFAATNRLRREGTRNLVAAAAAAGARRVVAQSIAFAYAPVGGWIKTEDDPLYRDAPPVFRDIFDAVIDLEDTVLDASGTESVVLRYGIFYGPGTSYAADGSMAEAVRQQRFPIAGGGPAHWSFIHVDDAAAATMAALTGPVGVFNVVDDEPAPVAAWLPVYAAALGAPEPRHVPAPDNDLGARGMLHQRGASNARAKDQLTWAPDHATWRTGFATALAG